MSEGRGIDLPLKGAVGYKAPVFALGFRLRFLSYTPTRRRCRERCKGKRACPASCHGVSSGRS